MGLSRCSRCPIWCADATHTQNLAKSDPATTPAPWTVQWHLKALKSARGLRRNRISPRSFPRDTCDNLRPNRPWRSPRVKNQAIELANSSHWRGRCSHVDSVEKSAYAKHLRTNKDPPLPRSDPHLCPKSPKKSGRQTKKSSGRSVAGGWTGEIGLVENRSLACGDFHSACGSARMEPCLSSI